MSEKDADDQIHPTENGSNSDLAQALHQEDNDLSGMLDCQCKEKENDLDLYLSPSESSSRKDENPFSFKKFLNQDLSAQKSKGARKKVFTMPTSSTSSNKLGLSNQSINRNSSDSGSRMVGATDKSSVLPDFVQDHLVVEQFNLERSSSIDLPSLKHQSFPDINLDRRNVHFSLDNDKAASHRSQNSFDLFSPNLPDFTLGASNFQSGSQATNERLPDFTLHARTGDSDVNMTVTGNNTNHVIHVGESQQRVQYSSSPSIPLDLPSYENNRSSQNLFIPFDLTAPAEEKTSSCRERSSNETVSKSLPDFLSDGPIKKELGENILNRRDTSNLTENGLSSAEVCLTRVEERLHREIDLLRHQLLEKNRVIESLERDLQLLHSTDQRETASLECALQEVENNLKQTVKRALNAEEMVLKLRQENKLLKSEISSLRSENVELRLGGYDYQSTPSEDVKNQKVAKELRSAATKAETSLKSLLKGLENLRALADSMESAHKFQEETKQYQNFSSEDSASGPAL